MLIGSEQASPKDILEAAAPKCRYVSPVGDIEGAAVKSLAPYVAEGHWLIYCLHGDVTDLAKPHPPLSAALLEITFNPD